MISRKIGLNGNAQDMVSVRQAKGHRRKFGFTRGQTTDNSKRQMFEIQIEQTSFVRF